MKTKDLYYIDYYERNINPKDFQVEDFVYVYSEDVKKLDKRCDGPYEITQVFENSNVEIALNNKRNEVKIVHINRLKLATIRPEPMQIDLD